MVNPEEERVMVASLQAKMERERSTAIEIELGDPGPYRFPRCKAVLSAGIEAANSFVLELETNKDQRVLIPINGSALQNLKLLVEHLHRSTNAAQRK